MISYDLWQNELNRWSYMGTGKLRTRLNRITKPDKLAAFMKMARERGERNLLAAAHVRSEKLGLDYLKSLYPIKYKPIPTQEMRNPQTNLQQPKKARPNRPPPQSTPSEMRAKGYEYNVAEKRWQKKKDKCVIGSKMTTARVVEVD